MKLEIRSHAPTGETRRTPLLFVHGAWHGAWCWDQGFMQWFAERGHAVTALSLRGHGASEGGDNLRWWRLRDYVEDVRSVIAGFEQAPVLIGHSMGGGVVQKLLETPNGIPAAVLMASLPPGGVLATSLRIARSHPLRFLRMNLSLSLKPLVEDPALVRELFYSDDLPAQQLLDYSAPLGDESYRAFIDMLALDRPRPKRVNTPMLVLGGQHDRVFLPSQVVATARAYGGTPVMFERAHNLMLETGWQKVAATIGDWLDQREL